MKKFVALMSVGVLATTLLSASSMGNKAEAAQPVIDLDHSTIHVLVNARKIKFSGTAAPYETSGRVMVPFRGVGEALGAKVGYSKNFVTFTGNDKTIQLTLGSKTAEVDGKKVQLDVPANAKKGTTYVPLRFLSENLGQPVEWDSVSHWVWIGKKEVPAIEDVTVKKDLVPYKKFFKNDDTSYKLLANSNKLSKVRIIEKKQLPIQMGGKTIYDINLVQDRSEYRIQVRYKGGGLGLQLFLLTDGSDVRQRVPENGLGEVKLADGTKVATYYISFIGDKIQLKDKSWKKFSIKTFDYICLRSLSSEDSVHLIANPFK